LEAAFCGDWKNPTATQSTRVAFRVQGTAARRLAAFEALLAGAIRKLGRRGRILANHKDMRQVRAEVPAALPLRGRTRRRSRLSSYANSSRINTEVIELLTQRAPGAKSLLEAAGPQDSARP